MKIRQANKNDIPSIIELLSDDKIARKRENYKLPLDQNYYRAFEKIANDLNQELFILENKSSEIVGTFQLTYIQYLTYQGGLRAQIEAVRIKQGYRNTGIGKKMISWAIERAKKRKVHLMQLTTDKERPNAIQFYQSLGFKPSHIGLKIHF